MFALSLSVCVHGDPFPSHCQSTSQSITHQAPAVLSSRGSTLQSLPDRLHCRCGTNATSRLPESSLILCLALLGLILPSVYLPRPASASLPPSQQLSSPCLLRSVESSGSAHLHLCNYSTNPHLDDCYPWVWVLQNYKKSVKLCDCFLLPLVTVWLQQFVWVRRREQAVKQWRKESSNSIWEKMKALIKFSHE